MLRKRKRREEGRLRDRKKLVSDVGTGDVVVCSAGGFFPIRVKV